VRLCSFDPFRALGIPGVQYIKPAEWMTRRQDLSQADWVLFAEYWQVNTLYYVLGCRLFPSVASYHLGHDKVEQTRALQALVPDHVPYTLISQSNDRSVEQVIEEFKFPVVAKQVRSARGEGVRLLESAADLRAFASEQETLYIQERLPIDRDIRIAWVGDEVVGAYWRLAQPGTFHSNISRGGAALYEAVPDAALDLVSNVAQNMGIDHAGFDVAMVDGHPYVLEFNVQFGNQALPIGQAKLAEHIHDYLSREPVPLPGAAG